MKKKRSRLLKLGRELTQGKPCHIRFCLATPTNPRVNMKRLPPKPAGQSSSTQTFPLGTTALLSTRLFSVAWMKPRTRCGAPPHAASRSTSSSCSITISPSSKAIRPQWKGQPLRLVRDWKVKTGFPHARGLCWRIRVTCSRHGLRHSARWITLSRWGSGSARDCGRPEQRYAKQCSDSHPKRRRDRLPHSHFPGIAKRSTAQLSPWHSQDMLRKLKSSPPI